MASHQWLGAFSYGILTALQSDEGGTNERMSGPLMSEYEGMIGIHETNPNAICHHVLSMYGPPFEAVHFIWTRASGYPADL